MTIQEKYGVDSISSCDSVKDKKLTTLMLKYGVDNPSKIPGVREKAAQTMLTRYAVDYVSSQARTVKHNYINSLGIDCTPEQANSITIGNLYRPISKELIEAKLGLREMTLDMLKKDYVHFYPVAHQYGLMKSKAVSTPAKVVCEWLDEIGVKYQTNNRKIIAPQELDIVIPEHNIAIEVNGYYWHDAFKTGKTNYHAEKTTSASQNGYQLLHFWDFEINERPELVKSIILSKLGHTSKIMARKCKIVSVPVDNQKDFFNTNHLSGYASSKICYGLLHDNEIIMMMSFSKYRFKNTDSWEIIRIASIHNVTVVGGVSKLLSHFINKHLPTSILSYADRRISNGNVYRRLGFKYIKTTPFGYGYYLPKTGMLSRQSMMKHKLVEAGYDKSKTESEIVKDIGFHKLCDAGHMLFELKVK